MTALCTSPGQASVDPRLVSLTCRTRPGRKCPRPTGEDAGARGSRSAPRWVATFPTASPQVPRARCAVCSDEPWSGGAHFLRAKRRFVFCPPSRRTAPRIRSVPNKYPTSSSGRAQLTRLRSHRVPRARACVTASLTLRILPRPTSPLMGYTPQRRRRVPPRGQG